MREFDAMYGSIVKLEFVDHDGVAMLSVTNEHTTGHRTTVFLNAGQATVMIDWILGVSQ